MIRISTVLLSLCLLSAATAAPPQYVYAAVDYMHIPDGKSPDDYIALEKLWQRLHQKAVDGGICLGWYMDRVENGGRNDFVTIRTYDSLNKMADPWPSSLTKGLFTDAEDAQMNKTDEARQLIHSELWRVEAATLKKMEGQSQHYAIVSFMKPKSGKDAEYYKMEKEIFSKIHGALKDAGLMNGWLFMSRMFPSGYDSDYDYITLSLYPDKAASEKGFEMSLIEKALTKDQLATSMKFLDYRSIVRSEIWYSVLQTVPAKK